MVSVGPLWHENTRFSRHAGDGSIELFVFGSDQQCRVPSNGYLASMSASSGEVGRYVAGGSGLLGWRE